MNGRVFVAMVLLGASSACFTGPQRVKYQPGDYLSANQPSKVWLTLNDDSKLVVSAPRVMADTLFGWDEDGTQDLTIPVSNIKEVRARHMSLLRTALIPAVIAGGSVAAIVMIKNAKEDAELSKSDSADLEIDP
jgi:hypothetical protein